MGASSSKRAGATAAAVVAIALIIATAALLRGGDAGAAPNGSDASSASPTAPLPSGVPEPSPGKPKSKGSGKAVPAGEVKTKAPVPLESPAGFGTGLKVELADIEATEAEASAPGEISGPALRVTVTATNDGAKQVSLDTVVVFLSYGADRAPASQFGTLSAPLAGSLKGGATRSGSYVYAVPTDAHGDVRVEVSYTGAAPTVAFEGPVDG